MVAYVFISRYKFSKDIYFPNSLATKKPLPPWQEVVVYPEKLSNWDGSGIIYVVRTLAMYFGTVALLGCIVLVPIYSSGTAPNVAGMNTLTMANVPMDSNAVWASWVFSLLFTSM